MPITRCSLQKQQSLEAVYSALVNDANSPVWAEIGYTMLAFLELINKTFPGTPLWGLTSHDRLVLLTNDDAYSTWWVIISCLGQKEIYFEYLMPSEKAPWPGARQASPCNRGSCFVALSYNTSSLHYSTLTLRRDE